MDFGIMFFSAVPQRETPDTTAYTLLMKAAEFADTHDFRCIWIPERHFHAFGGLYSNPALVHAALAMITKQIQLRAGSLISPLHDTVRIAEEWAFVDNLSAGRTAISFGSGWNVNDFIFYPERYAERQALMYQQIALIKRLWEGETVPFSNPLGQDFRLSTYPRPIQKELPVWITSSGNPATFVSAGSIGANILTHLIGQTVEQLADKIAAYRSALAEHGFDRTQGKVSLMLHTFMGNDIDTVRAVVKQPFSEYLKSAVHLEKEAAQGGGVVSGGHTIDASTIPDAVMNDLLDVTFERYFKGASLMGTPTTCVDLIWQLKKIGVDEIACLIDFIDDTVAILNSLEYVDELRRYFMQTHVSTTALHALTEDITEDEW